MRSTHSVFSLSLVLFSGAALDAQDERPGLSPTELRASDSSAPKGRIERTVRPAPRTSAGVSPYEIPNTYRSRVRRGLYEETPVPDVLVLEDGRRVEAYFLQAYGDRFVYYEKEGDRVWGRAAIPRSHVRTVLRGEYLERDPVAPAIRIGAKQPVRKSDVLSGSFSGKQDRWTTWRFRFYSESHKPGTYTEDATEFGSFVLESWRERGPYRGSTWSTGTYFLYAPRTVNNEDWVLVLEEISHVERDRTDHRSWLTGSVPNDTLIVKFSADGDRFGLLWSNLSSGTWSALPQVEFQRERGGTLESRDPSRAVYPRRTRPSGERPDPADLQFVRGDGAAVVDPWVAGVRTSPVPGKALTRATPVASRRRPIGARLRGWKRPEGRWIK